MKFKSWFILSEELYQNNTATIFHRTKSLERVQGMMNGGFTAGGGDWHGPGLYTTYTLEGTTNLGYGPYVVKLKVNNLKNYFVLEPDVAKQIHGDNYKLKDQARILELTLKLTDEEWQKYQKISESGQFGSAAASTALKDDGHFLWEHGCKGIVYNGSNDGKCICVYAPYEDLQFLAYAYAPEPTTVDFIEKNWVKSGKGVSIRSISDLKFPEDTGIGSTSVKKQYEIEPESVPLDIIYDFRRGKYSKLKLYLRKNKLNSQDIYDLLSGASDKGVSDKEKMAEILGPDNVNKLNDRNVYLLIHYTYDKEKMARILGPENINKLTGNNVWDLLRSVSDKGQIARILGPNNINKLNNDNITSLINNASDKEKMAEILGREKIDKLTNDHVSNLLYYASDKEKMARMLGSKNINKLSDENVKSLLSYHDVNEMSNVITKYKTKLSNNNVFDLLRSVSDKNKIAKILGSNNINKLSDRNVLDLIFTVHYDYETGDEDILCNPMVAEIIIKYKEKLTDMNIQDFKKCLGVDNFNNLIIKYHKEEEEPIAKYRKPSGKHKYKLEWIDNLITKSWLNEQSYAGIEDADSSQIERVYKKSRLAVKIVQDYDKQTGNNYLTNITTIAPISRAGIFGLYNSAENKAIIGKPFNQQKFTFSQEEIEKMKSLPEDVLRQHGIPDEVIKSLTPTDTIHVNVLNIYDTFNKAQKAGKMSPEEAQINIIREIASTIVHESTHDKERRKSGKTSEAGPEAAEQKFSSWFDQNLSSLKSRYPELVRTN